MKGMAVRRERGSCAVIAVRGIDTRRRARLVLRGLVALASVLLLAMACAGAGGDGSVARGQASEADALRSSKRGAPVASGVGETVSGETEFEEGAYSGTAPVSGAGVAVPGGASGNSWGVAGAGAAGTVLAGVNGGDLSGCVGSVAGGVLLAVVAGSDACPARSSAAAEESAVGDAEAAAGADDSSGLMLVQRAVEASGCAALFNLPGERLTLAAAGFAGGATVGLAGHAASLGDTSVSAPVLADATADADGVIEVSWLVPSVPAASVDPAPRGYAVVASGANPDGGTHTARLLSPVVAYPGVAPCAVADTALTALGKAVSIAVLGNDVAPTGGSLDAASVDVRAAVGGEFSVDSATGVVTFAPEAGFWGTVVTSYAVFDNWGIGVEADLAVTVDAGCTITGTAGVELIEGTEGDDVLCVPDREDRRAFHVIDAKGGDDVVLGGAGVEWIYGGNGADVIFGNGGEDRIVAGAGVDTVYGGPGMDSIYSVDLADTVIDGDHELVLSPSVAVAQSGPVAVGDWAWAGLSGTVEIDVLANDHDPNEDLAPATLRLTSAPASGAAAVAVDAAGRRVVSYAAPAAGGSVQFAYEVCDTLGACSTAEVTVMVGTSGCTIVGTEGDDMLRGTPGDDVICGLGGNDHIVGLGGDDVIVGGPGHDLVYADDPADGSVGGDDIVWGGQGHDTLLGGGGADRMWGGPGDDSVYGESGGDALVGGPGADTVSGGAGDDRLWGNADGDRLYGFEDDDAIWGGAGNDIVWGSPGDDRLWGGPGDDEMRGGPGADMIRAGPGDDEAAGQAGADAIWGGLGDDVLRGGPGDDEIHGGPGADTLHGDADDDRLWGGIDADTLDGGLGADHLDGGTGADVCTRAATSVGCGPAGLP